ncbi:hypothetical protein LTR36_008165 [Oleoguttula mirabilis]|uniref:Uncharacterized protein n=1 Tax=Oleoguttula mirabilis TaxID=1507867 RepID=A0AAV9J845_9PEZI|nr:hypothetical protein LTR36_008165 [Oleoguttula mirabilis]
MRPTRVDSQKEAIPRRRRAALLKAEPDMDDEEVERLVADGVVFEKACPPSELVPCGLDISYVVQPSDALWTTGSSDVEAEAVEIMQKCQSIGEWLVIKGGGANVSRAGAEQAAFTWLMEADDADDVSDVRNSLVLALGQRWVFEGIEKVRKAENSRK